MIEEIVCILIVVVLVFGQDALQKEAIRAQTDLQPASRPDTGSTETSEDR
jgi:hypothetical protein